MESVNSSCIFCIFSVSPSIPHITKNPPGKGSYIEGRDNVTLTCSSTANPVASYYWILAKSTEIVYDSDLVLASLTQEHTGEYTCVAYNTIRGTNHAAKSTIYIHVGKLPVLSLRLQFERDLGKLNSDLHVILRPHT